MNFRKAVILTAAAVCAMTATTSVSAQCTDPADCGPIRLNTVGYRVGFPKIATIAAEVPAGFVVRHAGTTTGTIGGVRHATGPFRNQDTGEDLWFLDFSDIEEPGDFYIVTQSHGNSPAFTIADDVFRDTYRTLMLGMYLWRCGNGNMDIPGAPAGVRAEFNGHIYSHPACHLNDGTIHPASGLVHAADPNRKDGTGGWHDAGDYNKYVVNSGVTIGLMLKAWENFYDVLADIPLHVVQNIGTLPAYLVEVKWNIDWVAKMQFDDGWVSHKLTTINFGGNILPSDESTTRFFIMAGTNSTATFAAILAQAARIYAPYIPEVAEGWLDQAKHAYDVVMESGFIWTDAVSWCNNPNMLTKPSGNPSNTGGYEQCDDNDKRQWAAAELWETTGDPRYLADLETGNGGARILASNVQINTEWAGVSNLAVMTYLNSLRSGRNETLRNAIYDALIARADEIVGNTKNHGYGRPMGTRYVWGANGAVASTAYILNQAYRFTGEEKYREAMHAVLDHLLGRNYQQRSFVTQVGFNPPVRPHCRRSMAQGLIGTRPWPGYLVGGPNDHSDPSSFGPGESCPVADQPATCYFDSYPDYARNEIAMNWNSAMIYALASMQPGSEAFTLESSCYPGQPGCEWSLSARQQTARRPAQRAQGVTVTRVVKTNRNTITIPPGSTVYSLNGRVVARRGLNDSQMPQIRKNGVYIIKTDAPRTPANAQ